MAISLTRSSLSSRPILTKTTQHLSLPLVRPIGRTAPRIMVTAAVREVKTVEQANELLKQGYKYLDVRQPDEFVNGHAPGAVNFNVLGEKFVQDVTRAFPDKESKLMVACQRGSRSTQAASQLADKYPNLVNFTGSFSAWMAAGMPVEK